MSPDSMTDADIGQLDTVQEWLHEGRIDAVVTSEDWRQDMNASTREAWDERTECAYCGHMVREHEAPPVTDNETWDDIAPDHDEQCEWVVTRAHRIEAES